MAVFSAKNSAHVHIPDDTNTNEGGHLTGFSIPAVVPSQTPQELANFAIFGTVLTTETASQAR